jgi:hypothetical protein
VRCLEFGRGELRTLGIDRAADLDVYTALVAGMASQQLANDPGGTRWRRLIPRVAQMYADQLGLPATTKKPRRKS